MSCENCETCMMINKFEKKEVHYETTSEIIFQKDEGYLKVKAQKEINIRSIDKIIDKLVRCKYTEELAYWNRRVLHEKICHPKNRYHYFCNLVCLYDFIKDFEMVLQYGQRAHIECGFQVLFQNCKAIFSILGKAAFELKRYDLASMYYKEKLRYGDYILKFFAF